MILCGGKSETIPLAEEYLPRSFCPLIKSSFGAVVGSCCGGADVCAHFGLADAIVAEATCDGKKKMYELLDEYARVYVLDLPQMPESPGAKAYYLSELERFKGLPGVADR